MKLQPSQKLLCFRGEELPLIVISNEGGEGYGVKGKWKHSYLVNVNKTLLTEVISSI